MQRKKLRGVYFDANGLIMHKDKTVFGRNSEGFWIRCGSEMIATRITFDAACDVLTTVLYGLEPATTLETYEDKAAS